MKISVVFAVFLFIASIGHAKEQPKSGVSDNPQILFLLGGQSNMAGNGFRADLPKTPEYAAYRSPPGNFSIWNAKEKKWDKLYLTTKFGPEIGFAHTLLRALPDTHIGLVKYAAGGTSMDQWAPDCNLYSRLVGDFQEAQQSVPDAKFGAILWHQGESDSDTVEVAEAYQAKLIQFIEAVRQDLNEADLLFIYGQINPAPTFRGLPRFVHADIVRKAQADLALPNTVMIKTDDFEKNVYIDGAAGTPEDNKIAKNEDNIHYSAIGQVKLGTRFAEIYLKTVEKNQRTF